MTMRKVFRDDVYDIAYHTLAALYEEGNDGVRRDFKRLETATVALVMYSQGKLSPVLLPDQVGVINTVCSVYTGTEAFDMSHGPDACAKAFRLAVEHKAARRDMRLQDTS